MLPFTAKESLLLGIIAIGIVIFQLFWGKITGVWRITREDNPGAFIFWNVVGAIIGIFFLIRGIILFH